MALWNLISLILIIATLKQAHKNNWAMPKLVSWATISGLWMIGSILLKFANEMA